MADTTTNEPAEQSDDVIAPTEDEQATQTPNDPVEPEKEEPAPSADDGLAQRLDALEQEVNALNRRRRNRRRSRKLQPWKTFSRIKRKDNDK